VGSIQPSDTDATDERVRLEALVNEAEKLVDLARDEAERIVEAARQETTRKVEMLMAQAEELRRTAEAESAEVLREAEEARRAARQEADDLLAEARRTHDEMIRRAGTVEAPDVGDARSEADKNLRLARAEAAARTAEVVEAGRRRAENMEAEARLRVEELRRQHREMQRRMRDEEMDARARIAALEERLQSAPPAVETPIRPPSEALVAVSAEVQTPPPDSVVPPRQEIEEQPTPKPAAEGAYPWSIRKQLAEASDDPDVQRALRAFRHRT
jgi:vacuolar-type H+-ATPase subunit H